jgi:hypothetical protein
MPNREWPMRLLKLSAGVAFVLAGVIGLVGCVWLPGGFQRVDGGPRPETQIGKAGSSKPLRIADATRTDVYRVLGPPSFESGDRRRLVYEYDVGTGLWLLCFVIPERTEEKRYLRIDFDESGRLGSYQVFKDLSQAGEGRLDAVPNTPKAPHG